jgi:hypothetical protein
MPKLGKRKKGEVSLRLEAALGAPRLIDRLSSGRVESPDWIIASGDRSLWDSCFRATDSFRREVAGSAPIVADNVASFYFADNPRDSWDTLLDFPSPVPPFPSIFLEMDRPSRCLIGDVAHPMAWAPRSWGWHLFTCDAATYHATFGPSFGRDLIIPDGWAGSFTFCRLACDWGRDRVEYPSAVAFLFLSPEGRVLSRPQFGLYGIQSLDVAGRDSFVELARCLFMPALLALSFMNCKNVALSPVEPNAGLNRLRRARGALPLVRHHTIDIGPMRRVLHTEGRMGEVGLRRALHQVRGHFSTYSPERPLFGKVAGTFWVPSHVRGDVARGVVVSDYRVNAPTVEVTP